MLFLLFLFLIKILFCCMFTSSMGSSSCVLTTATSFANIALGLPGVLPFVVNFCLRPLSLGSGAKGD